jgi:hypothetical protein
MEALSAESAECKNLITEEVQVAKILNLLPRELSYIHGHFGGIDLDYSNVKQSQITKRIRTEIQLLVMRKKWEENEAQKVFKESLEQIEKPKVFFTKRLQQKHYEKQYEHDNTHKKQRKCLIMMKHANTVKDTITRMKSVFSKTSTSQGEVSKRSPSKKMREIMMAVLLTIRHILADM